MIVKKKMEKLNNSANISMPIESLESLSISTGKTFNKKYRDRKKRDTSLSREEFV